jgi:hypothetical protein
MVDEISKKDTSNKGQDNIKDIKVKDASVPVFFDDAKLSFLYKKTERVTAALYLVTNLLSFNEPARVRLRERSLGVLSDVLSLTSSEGKALHVWAHGISLMTAEIAAILDVSRIAGHISEMNCSVLTREYEGLSHIAREYADTRATPQGHVFLPEDFFAIEAENIDFSLPRGAGREDTRPSPAIHRQAKLESPQSEARLSSPGTERVPQKLVRPEQTMGKVAGRKGDRRDSILSLVKSQASISVKDAARAIPGCSEKTVQRELLAMVAEGVLTKEGERRWSTYRLRTL